MFLLRIPDNLVTRIVLGARSSTSPMYVRRALEMNGFPNVQVIEAKQSLRTYDIEFQPVP